ncbi:MAG: ATP-binding cassette domain-containing protein, partial [Albidovulum sp.]|uniref:ATP-binding cassette domain-containing protein n=1 Tax=Albidovulum sp. TaxID=1872424 RepID=UPI003C8FF932
MTDPLLRVEDLRVTFELKRAGDMPWTKPRLLHAVSGVNFELFPGETLGIVGESGCGKSTLARALIHMVPGTGKAIWQGKTDLLKLSRREMLKYRADIQMVFQDPLASLNPRMTVGQIISEPLRTHKPDLSGEEVKTRVKKMMDRVGLLPNQINRYPHEFSGGQCQR